MPVLNPMDAPAIRWGILGAGTIADRFARAVSQWTSSSIHAVGARSKRGAQSFADTHAIPTAYEGYHDLVADSEIDAVYVATPHSFHADHAILAIKAGKPVLVEKPLTHTSASAHALVAAAREQGVFAMEAMKTRHLPHVAAIHDLIDNGEIGDIVYIQADHSQCLTHVPRLLDPTLAGGALLDLGVYPVSFVVDFLGLPTKVTARGRLTDRGVDAHSTALLEYPNAHAVMTTSFTGYGENRATIVGTEGHISIDGYFFNATSFRVHRRDGASWTFDGSPPNGLQYEAAEVARCLAAGECESARMPLDESIAIVELLDSIRQQIGVIYPHEPTSSAIHNSFQQSSKGITS
ncbi:MAG: Gfo/Idh/MocA family oxidoreductase [Actinomycetaceae bacterium]|nr:Gfo/Idh/MocA family oxidoreductase [Actinomycetaceae bacterium]